ncbi:MAG TPA: hypothetical protein VLK28_03475 [Methylomirabilota bacterium]|nr:hypothetical protein [Methylomirabilota bacterium]
MRKSWMLVLWTTTIAAGLIGLLAYTSESVHRVAPGATISGVARPAPTDHEIGPTYRNGLLLTH